MRYMNVDTSFFLSVTIYAFDRQTGRQLSMVTYTVRCVTLTVHFSL